MEEGAYIGEVGRRDPHWSAVQHRVDSDRNDQKQDGARTQQQRLRVGTHKGGPGTGNRGHHQDTGDHRGEHQRAEELGVDPEPGTDDENDPPPAPSRPFLQSREQRVPRDGEQQQLQGVGPCHLGHDDLQEVGQIDAAGDQPADPAKQPASEQIHDHGGCHPKECRGKAQQDLRRRDAKNSSDPQPGAQHDVVEDHVDLGPKEIATDHHPQRLRRQTPGVRFVEPDAEAEPVEDRGRRRDAHGNGREPFR